MISRRRTREYLLQMLYARACTPTNFDRDIFFDAYFGEDDIKMLDTKYLEAIEKEVIAHEAELLAIIALLAPKFEVATIPVIHTLILMMALTEMLYGKELNEEIHPTVSVNEAIELAKRFSDDQGKGFINGALSTFLKNKEKILQEKNEGEYRVFE